MQLRVRPGQERLLIALRIVATAFFAVPLAAVSLPDARAGSSRAVPDGVAPPVVTLRVARDDRDGFNLRIDARGFEFTPRRLGAESPMPEGYARLLVDGEPAARLYGPWHHLPGAALSPGRHVLRVQLRSNRHETWAWAGEPIEDAVAIDTRIAGPDPVLRTELRYRLAWDEAAIEPLPAGGWRTSNRLGYSFDVADGFVLTASLELVPCNEDERSAWGWLPIRPARAGHGLMSTDPSRLRRPVAESIRAPVPWTAESRTTTVPEYCRGHYLVSRPTPAWAESASDPRLRKGVSLRLEGRWRRGDSDPIPFVFSAESPRGILAPLVDRDGVERTVPAGERVAVVVVRPLASLFDGVAPDREPAERTAQRLLDNLTRHTRFVVEAGL